MIHGAALACSNTTSSTIATDIIPRERFAEGMGMFGVSTALATACAPALGIWVMNRLGFEALFLFATGSMILVFFLLQFLKLPAISVKKTAFHFKGLIDRDALPASAVMLVFFLHSVHWRISWRFLQVKEIFPVAGSFLQLWQECSL